MKYLKLLFVKFFVFIICFSFLTVFESHNELIDSFVYAENQKSHIKVTEREQKGGPSLVEGELYMFNEKGKLIKDQGLITYGDKEYYVQSDGRLKTGYQVVGRNLVYLSETTGELVKKAAVGYLILPDDGRLPYVYVEAYRVLNEYGWDLETAFKYSYPLKYYHKSLRLSCSESYADYGFKKRAGNCYVKAGMFFVMGKLLGYDIHQMCGYVKGESPHSWTEVHKNGEVYVCDPSFKNSYPSLNGYMFKYKTKGTYKYTDIKEVYSRY